MSHRPLALVSGLALGDYLLWSWSLGGSHDVLALVSGLTLPALAIAFVWLLALSLVRLIARSTDRSRIPASAGRGRADQDYGHGTGVSARTRGPADEGSASATTPAGSSGKLAA